MLKKKIKSVVIMAAILCSAGMVTTAMAAAAVAQDDLLQDAGSWMQIVGESSHKGLCRKVFRNQRQYAFFSN
jgi:hypothetical protein